MQPLLVETRPKTRRRARARKKDVRPLETQNQRVDAATLASVLQLQEQRREMVYSFIALSMKLGLLLLGAGSLVKLAISSHHRLIRHAELSSVLDVETARLIRLQNRFDEFFTIGGDKRVLDEHDQWIAPNRVRVIWR